MLACPTSAESSQNGRACSNDNICAKAPPAAFATSGCNQPAELLSDGRIIAIVVLQCEVRKGAMHQIMQDRAANKSATIPSVWT